MTLTYTYNGSALTHNVAPTSLTLATGAEMGNAMTGGLAIEDPSGTLTMLGHRPFIVTESACSQSRLFTGWTTERGIGRDDETGQFGNSTARIHDASIIDLNALFAFRKIRQDGRRPAETWNARLAWLLGSSYLTGLIEDTGAIVSNTRPMDASDYQGQYPSDVMNDLMDRAAGAYNYFAFWDTSAAAVGLWVNAIDAAVSDSTLRISNVLADVDGTTTFPPDPASRLAVTPDQTWSGVVVEYAHGTKRLFRSRPSTAAKYIRRETTISRPYTGSAATASAQAQAFLDQHANELDRITVTIILPAAKAGLVTAGQRMDVKFSHLPGYTTFTSMRVVSVKLTPTNDLASHYAAELELVSPRPAGEETSILLGFLAQRGGSDHDATIDPPGWTWLYGDNVGTADSNYPITLSGSSEVGTPTGTAIYNQSTGGTTFTSPSLAVSGAGYIFAGFSYMAAGPSDGASDPFVMDPAGDAVTLSRGYADGDYSPYSWFGYLPVSAAGTYSISLVRSAVPRNPTYPFGWQMIFVPSVSSIVQYGTVTALGGSVTYTWATPPGGGEADAAVWGSTLAGSSRPRAHHVQALVSAAADDTEDTFPTPPGVGAIIDQINNLEYLGDIPLGLPEL